MPVLCPDNGHARGAACAYQRVQRWHDALRHPRTEVLLHVWAGGKERTLCFTPMGLVGGALGGHR